MNTRIRHALAAVAAVAGLWSASTPSLAVVVAPGTTVALPGTTSAAEPFLAGVVLEDELINFSLPVSQTNPALITGTVQQRVVREDGTGTLDFYWRITELTGGSLGYLRVGNFVSAVYDANFRIDGLGDVGPSSLLRFTAGLGGATNDFAANFNFVNQAGGDSLAPGQSSKFMFLHTNATTYDKSAFFDIASTGTFTASASFAAFAPAPIPEPTSAALLLVGLLAMGAWSRRQHGSGSGA